MFKEIRFYSRGGQGGVTSAKILAYAGMLQGMETQAIPKYGSERKGAPIFVDVRLSDGPIRRHAPVVMGDADSFVVLEPTLVDKLPKTFTKDVIIVINSDTAPDIQAENATVGIVDAYRIADETGLIRTGTRLVSTTILGAWVKATAYLITLENIERAINKVFSGPTAEQNIRAIRMAHEQFQFVSLETVH